MKKNKSDKKKDDFDKIYRRNWLISIIVLGIVVFLLYFYPEMSS